jgi:hypothetical protein
MHDILVQHQIGLPSTPYQTPYNPHVPFWHLPPLYLFKPPFFSEASKRSNGPQPQSGVFSFDIRPIELAELAIAL